MEGLFRVQGFGFGFGLDVYRLLGFVTSQGFVVCFHKPSR